MNARCVTAGTVIVRVAIDDRFTRLERNLTLGQPAAPGLVLHGVTPDRVAGGDELSSDYRFRFAHAAPPFSR